MGANDGQFVWYEWMGKDLEGAARFYAHVVGWTMGDPGMAPFPYKVGAVGNYGVCGMLSTPPEAQGAPPCWTGYILVEDVDAAFAKLKSAGGHVMREPMDIPNVGRFAIVTDPQGAPFALFKDAGGPSRPRLPPSTAGLTGWREHAADGASAMSFYAQQFGWREDSQLDMGPMGAYRIFDIGGQQGGMMSKMPQGPGPCWIYYFLVEAADAAAARVADKGGKLLHGPHEVPGGMWAMQCADPEGALFGLVAAKR